MSTVAVAFGLASPPDLLRLALVPVFAWAAYRDVRTRRLPNRLWPPLYAAGGLLLAWEAWLRWPPGGVGGRPFAIRVAVSLLVVAPLGYLLWRLGGFGGADAKALIALAIAVPTFPTYFLPGTALPLVVTPLGVFSLTVLTNAALLAAAYPVALAVRNALAGRLRPAMFLARPIQIDRLSTAHGRLFETRTGTTRRGLDLDALRMYLRWRGLDLATLRADPDRHRDSESVGTTRHPTDGAVTATAPVPGRNSESDSGSDPGPSPDSDPDPGTAAGATRSDGRGSDTAPVADSDAAGVETDPEPEPEPDPGLDSDPDPDADGGPSDPWAAERFLAELDGNAYGTTPASLREGLETVVARERVWISPGLPFVVPLFLGLVVGLTYGDLLFGVLGALGLG